MFRATSSEIARPMMLCDDENQELSGVNGSLRDRHPDKFEHIAITNVYYVKLQEKLKLEENVILY